jgi:hypothetical protein
MSRTAVGVGWAVWVLESGIVQHWRHRSFASSPILLLLAQVFIDREARWSLNAEGRIAHNYVNNSLKPTEPIPNKVDSCEALPG